MKCRCRKTKVKFTDEVDGGGALVDVKEIQGRPMPNTLEWALFWYEKKGIA